MESNRPRTEQVELRKIKRQNYTLKESLRALRTNLQFCGDDVKVILVTSAAPNEGKSTVVMDLARSLTDAKKQVLVIDADLRQSVLVGRLGVRTASGASLYGLSHYLSGQKQIGDVVYATNIPRLYLVFSGPSVPNPTEILEKGYFDELINFGRKYFDYILIDAPPLGATIDAAVLARCCDGAIFVTAQGMANSHVIANAKKQLELSGVRILGAVLNKVDMRRNHYYGKYYGRYYGSYYGQYGRYGKETDGKKNTD
ncbi:MAG: polysaccharide biosynthesis tyrosine autokinase [Clostridiales bacterium]|nr:polysaccharide biosynthesis tyrosine autokinase [Clostridiales bacterium]